MKKLITIPLLTVVLLLGLSVANGEDVYAATTQEVSLTLSNGGTYYGEVQDGKPHGKGTATWGEYKTYIGEWKYGKRSGKGEFIITIPETTQVIYDGTWGYDKQNGQGTLIEYSKFNEFSEEYDRATAQQGSFKSGIPVSGYSVIRDYTLESEVGFRYTTDDVIVAYALTDTNEMNAPLKAENMSLFAFVNLKKGSGFLMQYTDDSQNMYQYGTYKKDSSGGTLLYNGKIELFNRHYDEISIANVQKSKIATFKAVPTSEKLYSYRERIIKKKLYLLDPYISNFKKLFNQL
ncbi:hypothetical protein [Paenibacillus illinoisensis]|uniref:MORN repeat-containing protein n=1 Tax=Paenibacillus illinoisensis TaxID=59845 RepID=A0A2W0CAF8_9BACL|nr:hypothetical protein [Paenibacillus illinoisensis]PYY29650.1 MORN repeat-containing protein [Paenibacillus illinoisensis]